MGVGAQSLKEVAIQYLQDLQTDELYESRLVRTYHAQFESILCNERFFAILNWGIEKSLIG